MFWDLLFFRLCNRCGRTRGTKMFLTPLIVKEHTSSHWTLVRELIYVGNEDQFYVPEGFCTDFASVPKAFHSIISPTGYHTKAAVVHDYLYQCKPKVHRGQNVYETITRKEADGVFARIMRELGVPCWKISIMYNSVRIAGGRSWTTT